jgi:RNA:NAD 2'-phosphotransferase (TPT1/KptA family)
MKKWEKVYHGTKYKYLESIMEIGLKKPGDKDKYGNFISE